MKTFLEFGIDINLNARGNVKAKCPNCAPIKSNPNDTCLSVNIDEGVWNCHKCGWTGTLKGANKAVKASYNANKAFKPANPTQYKETPLQSLSEGSIAFLAKRGISEKVALSEGIRVAKKWMPQVGKEQNVLAFPFIKDNKRVATKYRDDKKNMCQDKGGEKCFYRFDEMKKGKKIYITEGEIDALTLVQCGFSDGVTSVPDGAPNAGTVNLNNKFNYFTEEAMKIFDNAKEVYLIVDDDENGRFLENELKRRIGIDKCLTVNYPDDCKDINDVLVKFNEDAVKEVIQKAEHFPVDGLKTFEDYSQDIYDMHNGITEDVYATGWDYFDAEEFFKIRLGQLNIVTGSPGSGKSEWVDDLMINTLKMHNFKWAVFSPENYPPTIYFRKLAEKYVGKNFESFSENEVGVSINDLSENIKLIVDTEDEDVTIDFLFERIRTLVFRHGIKGVILDPWNEVTHDIGNREDLYLSKVLKRIKRFIRKYGISFWLVAHPKNPARNKDGKYPKVTAYDIAGGYTWFSKADQVFSVHRHKDNPSMPVEVHIQKIKQKTDGKLGTAYFHYDFNTGSYTSVPAPNEVEDKGGENVNGVKVSLLNKPLPDVADEDDF